MEDKVIKLNSPVFFRGVNGKICKIIDSNTYIFKPKDKSKHNVVVFGAELKNLYKGWNTQKVDYLK